MEVIKNEQEKGRRFVNKLSVGERHLAAAIRMYFLELDPLAIHLVSSAAHNLFADLLADRGKDASVHGVIYGILRAAKDLQTEAISEDEIRGWGHGSLELVKDYCSLFEKHPDISLDEISSSAPSEFARAYWSDRRRSYNYLKHADRDAGKLLDEATVNNEDTILQAIICSQHLNLRHSAEKHFFSCAMIALGKMKGRKEAPFDLELLLSGMSRSEIMALGRGNLCRASYADDEHHRKLARAKMEKNLSRIDGQHIKFFSPD